MSPNNDYPSPSVTSSSSYPNGLSMHVSPMLSRSSSTSSYAPQQAARRTAEWDYTTQQHIYKRPRYDDYPGSSSSTSPNAAYQDARARQTYDAHYRIASNHSQSSSKGNQLPPISPHQPNAAAMAASTSLPPITSVSPPSRRSIGSPNPVHRSVDTSPANRTSPVVANASQRSYVPLGHAAHDHAAAQHRIPASHSFPPGYATASSASASHRINGNDHDSRSEAPLSPSPRRSSNSSQPRHKPVFDYTSTDADPEEFIAAVHSLPRVVMTQPNKGADAYFGMLQAVARMDQGQAMAHALAALIAARQASADDGTHPVDKDSDALKSLANMSEDQLVAAAERHHLSAVKALQQQQHQPSRRRRFSVIETNSSTNGDELPPGSNAATMLLLILACSSIGKSLMLPSYFNQAEQFLADAVEHISIQRLFPSVNGETILGSPEDPPIMPPDNLTNYGRLLFLGTVVGVYECCLAQYTAITDWDYNPARLKRLLPFNWTNSDAAIFEQTRNTVAETTFSISMVTLELITETLDTMRRFKRAEEVAYGNRKSSRSTAEDGSAALDSLALREELGLVIRDLEAGTFWKGAARTLSEAEQLLALKSIDRQLSEDDTAEVEDHKTNGSSITPSTEPYKSGRLFLTSSNSERKHDVNRLRLGNHLYRNALLIDLYVSVFNRPASSLAVRELVSRSIALLGAIPDKLEQGLMWPSLVFGSYAQNDTERDQVRSFVRRSKWKSTAGPSTAFDVLERVWNREADSWRESVTYFGSQYIC
uniref:Uncharacterized protein n=1 Tax=Kalmanozyma brasiliensis (strain GHG001) TaxID=1365824 RepID=V5EWX7_KALBG